ncbi:AbrB/MazE/SpoVT family DNA-binding domain-containing protein [Bacillus cereus]|uniref:AbrB/MazE/SpoVT family DNA-binding domain-containing protein n=1 Tax=Bacillus cereus TaxID=1396 RepID=UPI0018CD253A|nr:AbrB/MazE/SpoVT family DNA-binding domain-containing protein [Bacillus cereus]MBG9615770.1 AbrB family transcriptional regulator [Bacillus cereus]
MKSTSIVRKIDDLGRIVIPRETRRILNIHEKDPLEIFVDSEMIVLQKYKSYGTCLVTGEVSSTNMKLADGKLTLSLEGAKQLLTELQSLSERESLSSLGMG